MGEFWSGLWGGISSLWNGAVLTAPIWTFLGGIWLAITGIIVEIGFAILGGILG